MKLISTLLILSFICSCQTDNSNSFDDILGSSSIDPNNPNLVKAYAVIEERCINCHEGYHNNYASLDTDEKWIASGNVTAGIIGDSPLITKLKNRGGNMPKGGANLTEDEYNALVTWIEGL
tara:strand:+ start:988 stop:1350 length:363 start_codon:yes stop_codon:yes gene_type:complete